MEDALSSGQLEAKFIEHGKAYGYDSDKLREYVEERLTAERNRSERRENRELDKIKIAMEELEKKLVDAESRSHNTSLADIDAVDTYARSQGVRSGHIPVLKIPKYDGKQQVVDYLQLFEEIVEQNKYADDEWLLRLKVAVAGSKLERCCQGCRTYEAAKRELLVAFGTTPEKAWKAVLHLQQHAEESFRQFVVRSAQAVSVWSKQAFPTEGGVDLSSNDSEGILEGLTKQVVVESCSPELKAFLLERKCHELPLEEFQAVGLSYQEAHGRKSATVKQKQSQGSSKPSFQATAQCMSISISEIERKLHGLTVDERRAYVKAEQLCWNCLKGNHVARKCYSPERCGTCLKRHHTLLHQSSPVPSTAPTKSDKSEAKPKAEVKPGTSIEVETVDVVANGCESTQGVRLMTGVGRLRAEAGSARVRVFLDTGSQASFMSEELVQALKPKLLGTESVSVKAFGVEPVVETMERYSLTLCGKSKPIEISAWKRKSLNMAPGHIDKETALQWKAKGVELSDQVMEGVPSAVHLLLGADYCNDVINGKSVVHGKSVWDTEIGWILAGAAQDDVPPKEPTVEVRCVELDRLWQMDEVPTASMIPDFPMKKTAEGYEVGLLWKSERRPPDNLPQAMATAQALMNKLERQRKRQDYDSVLLDEYLKLDAIELEPEPATPGYYLPHHAVFKTDSTTTKTRVVFNASASMQAGKSLNDMLDAGPSLLPDLAGLLLRFREYPCALQADIRKAFFMVGMRDEDRPYLRFVWPDMHEQEMKIWRLKKLPFGVNCSPFILSAVLKCHLECMLESASDAEAAIIRLLLQSFYVDDFVTSVLSASYADRLQEFSVDSLQGAGMMLRKWRGNSIASDSEAGAKVLGVVWDDESDVLSVASIGEVSAVSVWSRRVLLKCVASIFDPLGFVCPSTLLGKQLLQECWKLDDVGGWDDQLPDELSLRCSEWWGACSDVSHVCIPRWLGCVEDSVVDLHVFADASEKGYGCCIYVVCDGVSSLLFAKSKVAPVSPPSIARLELQAVHLASRVLRFVVSQLRVKIGCIIGWTDSLTTWHWLQSPSYRWKTYVANRVSAIHEVAKELKVEWRHVPGESNPADLPSRGVLPCELQGDFWQHGPGWLVNPENWPKSDGAKPEDALLEARVSAIQVEPQISWQWDRFSKWQRARGMVVRILSLSRRSETRAELVPEAERIMYRAIQAECFPEEVALLQAGQALPKESKLFSLAPFLDEVGIIRVGGRLQESSLPYATQHPIVLGKHCLTTLLLERIHQQRMHQGVESVLAFIREQFWVFSVRRQLRNLSEKCITCRWFRAQAASESTAPLPEDRVTYSKPFSLTGIDYAGPLYVRKEGKEVKVWIALFVCGTTRAVHLEVVESLSTDDFLLAFRRFVARCSMPTRIRSDNATTFKAAAEKVLVTWVFNPPAAPWHGGFYERMVGSVKAPLKKVLGKASLSVMELTTLITEVEKLVNDRPLTSVSTDLKDEGPLTPAKLCGDVFVAGDSAETEALTAPQAKSRWAYVKQVRAHLEQRWWAEYVTSLRQHYEGRSSPLKPGDVVLLVDNQKKRHLWRMARVIEVYPGKDGKCRVARVKVGQSSMLRAIRCLVPLEVGTVDEKPQPDPSSEVVPEASTAPEATGQVVRRSGRAVKSVDRLDL